MTADISAGVMVLTLPSGNRAIYELPPQFDAMVARHAPAPPSQVALNFGRQLAHEHQRSWYGPGSWDRLEPDKLRMLLGRLLTPKR